MQILAILIPALCIVLGFMFLLKWPADRQRTFSEHVTGRKISLILFMILFPLLTIPYYYFLAVWFGPHIEMPQVYYWLLVAAFISQLLLTWIPAKKGPLLTWHFAFALVVTIVMIFIAVLVLVLAVEQQRLLNIMLSLAYIILNSVIFTSYFVRHRVTFVRRNLLALEMSFFLLFWIFVAVLTYA